MTCGDGVIARDVVCMKKLGSIMAVVGDDNCLLDDKPDTERQCERPACRPRWYTTDWSQARNLLHSLSLSSFIYLFDQSNVHCSLAVVDPRVGHAVDVLSPFIPVLCHSD